MGNLLLLGAGSPGPSVQPAPFAPSDLPNLALWLRADAGTFQDAALTTPATADGATLQGWQDQSGQGNHFTQSNAAKKCTLKLAIQNGLPVIRFDGTASYLTSSFTPSGQFALFIVRKYAAFTTATQMLLSCHKTGNPDGGFVLAAYDPSGTQQHLLLQTGTGGTWPSGVSNVAVTTLTTNWTITELRIDTGFTRAFVQGSELLDDETHGAIAAGSHLVLGSDAMTPGTSLFTGDVGEVILFSVPLSTADRVRIYTYLNNKWGILAAGTAYFLDPAGNDTNTGLAGHPWQSLAHASSATFKPGDSLTLTGTFSGNLALTDANFTAAPSSYQPFTITGSATINCGNGSGISCTNIPNVVVNGNGLTVTGAGVMVTMGSPNTSTTTSTAAGIYFQNAAGSFRLSGPTITGCTVSGCISGIELDTGAAAVGFKDPVIQNNVVHDNLWWGIRVGNDNKAVTPNNVFIFGSHANAVIKGNESHHNCGDSTNARHNTGYGMWLNSLNGFEDSFNSTHDNGLASPLDASASGGPCGHMLLNSRNGTLHDCRSYNNHDQSGVDGQGFDCDGGCQDIICERLFSYGNTGYAFYAFSVGGFSTTNNITYRNCISERDRGLFMASGGAVTGAVCEYCTGFSDTGDPTFALVRGSTSDPTTVVNCTFVIRGAVKFTEMSATDVLAGNTYDTSGTFAAKVGATTYGSLAALHAAGIEQHSSVNYGFQGGASLTNPGGGSALPPTSPINALTAYDPTASVGAPITLSLLGLTAPSTDFHGNARTGVGAVSS